MEKVICAHCGANSPRHKVDCPAVAPFEWPEIGQKSNARQRLLSEAASLISGDRATDYGDASENFARIARGWSEIVGVEVNSVQVALCMDWLKTCRLITSPTHRDSWIDKLGYGALGGEISAL